jgi:hypothetical protein
MYGGVEIQLHTFLALITDEGKLSLSCLGFCTPKEKAMVPNGQKVGWVSEAAKMVWQREKSLPLPRIKPQSSSPQPKHYPD